MLRCALIITALAAALPAAAQQKPPEKKSPAASKPAPKSPAAAPKSAPATAKPKTETPPAPEPVPSPKPETTPAPQEAPPPAKPAAEPTAVPPPVVEVRTPPAPPDRIWDQAAMWTADQRQVAAAELNAAATQLRFSVYLVNLNAPPDEQPSDFARRLLMAWTEIPDRAIVLSGGTPNSTVVIECGGDKLGSVTQESRNAFIAAAQAEAAKAPPGLPAGMAAARSLIAQMNTFRVTGQLGPASAAPQAEASSEAPTSDRSLLWLALGAISVVLLMAAAFFMKRRQTTALIFPPVEFRRRFSAPHSGGNNALVSFGQGSSPPPRENP